MPRWAASPLTRWWSGSPPRSIPGCDRQRRPEFQMAHPLLDTSGSTGARLIRAASPETWPQVASALSPTARAFAKAQDFAPKPGAVLIVPDAEGAIEAVVLGD